MPKNKVDDIIFEGGMTSDVELPEEGSKQDTFKDADMFDVLNNATEEDMEESLQEGEELEEEVEEDPTPNKKGKISTVELLLQQNQLLQQQLANMSGHQKLAPEEQRALEMGRTLANIQQQNLPLFNKLNAFISNELSGESLKVQNTKLQELKQMLKGDKFKSVDTSPFEAMIEAVELTEGATKKETQQLIQVINSLQRELNHIKTDRDTEAKRAIEDQERQALLTLKKAELDFGKKLVKGSEEAEDFVLLVRAGRDPRTAYLKVMGLKESDKIKKAPPKEVNLNPKVDKGKSPLIGSPASRKLADKLFANTKTSKDIFKAR